tara:strand:- start:348 stop:830 length:483 start_codon:yes stop_codon:yes gene_type:complete
MDIYKTIIVGVISGVITSAFIFLCVKVFVQIILPWYRSAIYKGIDICGTWTETVEYNGATDVSQYIFHQNERIISGTKAIVKTDKETGVCETKLLTLNGKFLDGHLLLTAVSSDRKVQSLSTYLFRIGKGGAALIGQANWVDSNSEIIHSRNIELIRKVA